MLPFNDLTVEAAAIEQGYAVLTGNLRHFQKIPLSGVLEQCIRPSPPGLVIGFIKVHPAKACCPSPNPYK